MMAMTNEAYNALPQKYRAYCTRPETKLAGGGRFGHTARTLPAAFAVQDRFGMIVKRFSTLAEAETFATERNALEV